MTSFDIHRHGSGIELAVHVYEVSAAKSGLFIPRPLCTIGTPGGILPNVMPTLSASLGIPVPEDSVLLDSVESVAYNSLRDSIVGVLLKADFPYEESTMAADRALVIVDQTLEATDRDALGDHPGHYL